MDTINLGRVELVYRPESVQPKSLAPTAVSHKAEAVSLDTARQMTGWSLSQPSYLPFANMQLTAVLVSGANGRFDSAILKYRTNHGYWLLFRHQFIPGCSNCRRISISYPLRQGEVNRLPAALYDHAVIAASAPGGVLNLLNCCWEHGDYLLELEAPSLSDQTAIHVAESLA